MRIQAVVKYGDRHWNSIRDSAKEALFQVCEYIKNTAPEFREVTVFAQFMLVNNKVENARQVLENEGFDIQFKGI